MTEPTMRDRERIAWLAERAGLVPGHQREQWIRAGIEILAAAREEGRREERAQYSSGYRFKIAVPGVYRVSFSIGGLCVLDRMLDENATLSDLSGATQGVPSPKPPKNGQD